VCQKFIEQVLDGEGLDVFSSDLSKLFEYLNRSLSQFSPRGIITKPITIKFLRSLHKQLQRDQRTYPRGQQVLRDFENQFRKYI